MAMCWNIPTFGKSCRALGKTSFSDIAAHQRDDLFADAICGSHGGRRHLRLGRNCHVADVFMAIGARLAA